MNLWQTWLMGREKNRGCDTAARKTVGMWYVHTSTTDAAAEYYGNMLVEMTMDERPFGPRPIFCDFI
jgi:hypothetical protein